MKIVAFVLAILVACGCKADCEKAMGNVAKLLDDADPHGLWFGEASWQDGRGSRDKAIESWTKRQLAGCRTAYTQAQLNCLASANTVADANGCEKIK